jgi:hypothetical protein
MEPGEYAFAGLVPDAYSVLTVWAGSLSAHAANGVMCLGPGETAFVSALPNNAPPGLRFSLEADAAGNCGAAFFSIDAR